MAKSQKHSNREAKKPKQVKVAAPVAADGLLGKARLGPNGSTKKRA
jgi:hypothetical protein